MKNEIRIGDVLYEPSVTYKRVIEHKIVDMYLEAFISGWGTIVVTESYMGRGKKFASDIKNWHFDKEDAELALTKRLESIAK
jgi:hypothetical protein